MNKRSENAGPIQRVLVVGYGVMGRGIALTFGTIYLLWRLTDRAQRLVGRSKRQARGAELGESFGPLPPDGDLGDFPAKRQGASANG